MQIQIQIFVVMLLAMGVLSAPTGMKAPIKKSPVAKTMRKPIAAKPNPGMKAPIKKSPVAVMAPSKAAPIANRELQSPNASPNALAMTKPPNPGNGSRPRNMIFMGRAPSVSMMGVGRSPRAMRWFKGMSPVWNPAPSTPAPSTAPVSPPV